MAACFRRLQDVDGGKICGGLVRFELSILLKGRFLLEIKARFDASKEFESAGLKGIGNLLKRVDAWR